MKKNHVLLAVGLALALPVRAEMAEGTITWHDPTCGFFAMTLPEGPVERFGLYSWKSGPDPKMGQVWAGDIVKGEDIDIVNKETGDKMAVIHWANAKEQAQLVRNTPVQCRDRWKKK